MTDHYKQLKNQLHRLDIDYGYLAATLHRSRRYVELAMTGKLQFGIDECYMILSVVKEDEAKLNELFPYKGIRRFAS